MTKSRKELGRELVGAPMMQALEDVMVAHEAERWKTVNRKPLVYYTERMLLKWLPNEIDQVVSDDELAALSPDAVRRVTLLLIRDLYRQHEHALAPNLPPGWVDEIFRDVEDDVGIRLETLERFDLDHIRTTTWPQKLAEILALPKDRAPTFAMKVFVLHASMVGGVAEEVLGTAHPHDD